MLKRKRRKKEVRLTEQGEELVKLGGQIEIVLPHIHNGTNENADSVQVLLDASCMEKNSRFNIIQPS